MYLYEFIQLKYRLKYKMTNNSKIKKKKITKKVVIRSRRQTYRHHNGQTKKDKWENNYTKETSLKIRVNTCAPESIISLTQ